MARAMPVISISRPRKTKSGTDSRMRWLMPSSIRPTTTVAGVVVVRVMKAKVARPNANAIGTAANTITATSPTKKMRRLMLPSGIKNRAQQIEHAANAHDEGDGAAGQLPVADRG